MNATALIAEDEPMRAANLQAELALVWPGLRVVANVRHGAAALERALALQPDLRFLDIRMSGMSGIDAAHALAEDWPDVLTEGGKPFPLLVFVTAYDQYAVQAFENAAIDHVLKPVLPARLRRPIVIFSVMRLTPYPYTEFILSSCRADRSRDVIRNEG